MSKSVAFILNLPMSLIGIIFLILSGPVSIKVSSKPLTLVANIQSFWWARFTYMRYARAMTIGNVILNGPRLLKNDLEHELIHIKQQQKYPLIFPILYALEQLKGGTRGNRFEEEAYRLSNSIYEREKK